MTFLNWKKLNIELEKLKRKREIMISLLKKYEKIKKK